MRNRQRRSRVLGVWLAAGALGGSGVLAAGSAAATTFQPRTTLNGWHQLSSGVVTSTGSIGLARFGTALQAVWIQDTAGPSQTLRTRVVDTGGAPTTASIAVASSWSQLSTFPVIFGLGKQRVIAFSGIHDSSDSSDPYSVGYEYYLTSSNGTSWSLADGALSEHPTAYGSEGTDAVNAGGTPVLGYTDGAPTSVEYHSGFITPMPTTAGADQQTTPLGGCCVYDTGVGYDAASKTTWTVFYSNANEGKQNGILAQRIEPSLGVQSNAPSSSTVSGGEFASIPPGQRIVTAARVGGGIYASYFVGYPSPTKVALWKLGAAKAMTHTTGGNVGRVGVAAAPGGRIWLYWWDASSHTVQATETNAAVTQFGPVCHVTTPNKTTDVWDLVGNASKGPLQVFAIAGAQAHAQVYDTVIKPC